MTTHDRIVAARDDAAFRELLHGTVFDPRPAGGTAEPRHAAQERPLPADEDGGPAAAHCRSAMYYVD
ncbi:hypothetical protein AB0K51_21615 [Kitasatospora sp. NPDC049285]|uniref:hypothetical protein n=1 Tax=Kitasatospora sp. NPDC049285 TaxID=3157096 RepID=UPI003438606F